MDEGMYEEGQDDINDMDTTEAIAGSDGEQHRRSGTAPSVQDARRKRGDRKKESGRRRKDEEQKQKGRRRHRDDDRREQEETGEVRQRLVYRSVDGTWDFTTTKYRDTDPGRVAIYSKSTDDAHPSLVDAWICEWNPQSGWIMAPGVKVRQVSNVIGVSGIQGWRAVYNGKYVLAKTRFNNHNMWLQTSEIERNERASKGNTTRTESAPVRIEERRASKVRSCSKTSLAMSLAEDRGDPSDVEHDDLRLRRAIDQSVAVSESQEREHLETTRTEAEEPVRTKSVPAAARTPEWYAEAKRREQLESMEPKLQQSVHRVARPRRNEGRRQLKQP